MQKLNQSQSQTQKLTLSPQIKLYLKILQMPLLELKANLEEELNQNPLLEEEPPSEIEIDESLDEATSSDATEKIENWEGSDEELSQDGPHDETLADSKELTRKKNYQDSIITQEKTLTDHIHAQLHLLSLTEKEKKWTEELIGSLNENGFLTNNLAELSSQLDAPEKDLERLLAKLRSLDPAGIFSYSLEDCLLIQLERSPDKNSLLAQTLVRDHFNLLQKRSFPQIARLLKAPAEKVKAAFELIQSLDPKPGKSFISSRPFQIVPDAVITLDRNDPKKYHLDIRSSGLPPLRLNSEYRKMIKNKAVEPATKKFIKEKAEQAIWLLEALENRKSTLGSILKVILDRQPDFLERGFTGLKPLRMKEVADTLGIHESTVSRAVSGKYLESPRGTFSLRSFFSGKIASGSESEESQKSIMERIKTLVEAEDPQHPLSDQKIVQLLAQDGITIARRTIAKYRDMLKILPTNLRRKR